MKKLLSIIAVSAFALGIMIIGRPVTEGLNKGEDFFIVNYGDDSDVLHNFWYEGGNLKGWNTITKDKADELLKQFELKQKSNTSA